MLRKNELDVLEATNVELFFGRAGRLGVLRAGNFHSFDCDLFSDTHIVTQNVHLKHIVEVVIIITTRFMYMYGTYLYVYVYIHTSSKSNWDVTGLSCFHWLWRRIMSCRITLPFELTVHIALLGPLLYIKWFLVLSNMIGPWVRSLSQSSFHSANCIMDDMIGVGNLLWTTIAWAWQEAARHTSWPQIMMAFLLECACLKPTME